MEYVNTFNSRLRRHLSGNDTGACDGNLYRVSGSRCSCNIISAGFVEQYQRKSSLSNLKNADIKQIAEIFVDKRYAGKSIEEVEEQEQLTIFLILREDLSILPQKDTLLKQGDIIIIRAEGEKE